MTSKAILVAALTAFAATVGPGGTAQADSADPGDLSVEWQRTRSPTTSPTNSRAGQTQQAHVPLPWKTQFTVIGTQVFVISAQGPGSITCTILVDGKVVNQATANGAPARTVCST